MGDLFNSHILLFNAVTKPFKVFQVQVLTYYPDTIIIVKMPSSKHYMETARSSQRRRCFGLAWRRAACAAVSIMATLCCVTFSPSNLVFRRRLGVFDYLPFSLFESSSSDPGTPLPRYGRKTALLITISYRGKGELSGTIPDGVRMREYLEEKGFHITWMRDDLKEGARSKLYPTKRNIEEQLKNLRRTAASGDVIWVYYSGHGTQNKEGYASSEEDKLNEGICPTDYHRSGMIWDNWLSSEFAKKLPQGTQTIMMFDCCHSGTCLDLPYQYDGEWKKTRPANPDDPFVLYLSGCRDGQLSREDNCTSVFNVMLDFDHFFNGVNQGGGVLTTKFLNSAKKYGDDAPLKKYLDNIQSSIKLNWLYNQSPCLSSSHRISVNQSFSNFLDGGVKIKGRRASGTQARSIRKVYHDRMHRIYSQHSEYHLTKIDSLLDKYAGREHDIYTKICKKYGVYIEPRFNGFSE